jgi:hypothetical protein
MSRATLPGPGDTLVEEDRWERRLSALEARVEEHYRGLDERLSRLEADFGVSGDEMAGTVATGMRKAWGDMRREMVSLGTAIKDLREQLQSDQRERARERDAIAKAADVATEKRKPWQRIGWTALLAFVGIAVAGLCTVAIDYVKAHWH